MLWHRLRFLPHLEPKFPCQNAELIIRPLLNRLYSKKIDYLKFVNLNRVNVFQGLTTVTFVATKARNCGNKVLYLWCNKPKVFAFGISYSVQSG